MILLNKESNGLYYISRRNLYNLLPYIPINDFSDLTTNDYFKALKHKIIKDEVSPNRIEISKNFRLDKDGIIFHKMRIKKLEK